jgi:hypothetical protein
MILHSTMLSLGIKQAEHIDLYTQIRKHIEEFIEYKSL